MDSKVVWYIAIAFFAILFTIGIYNFWRSGAYDKWADEMQPVKAMIFTIATLVAFIILGFIFGGGECVARFGC